MLGARVGRVESRRSAAEAARRKGRRRKVRPRAWELKSVQQKSEGPNGVRGQEVPGEAPATLQREGSFSSDPAVPLQHRGLQSSGYGLEVGVQDFSTVTWPLPTPHMAFPATRCPSFPAGYDALHAFPFADPTAWAPFPLCCWCPRNP